MLDLIVYVKYERKKARLLLDMHEEEVAQTIRRDFASMKLPHPPQANIKKPTLKGVTASWTTGKYSKLYSIVTAVVDDQDLDPRIKRAKFDQDIEYLILREKPHTLNSPRSELGTSRRRRRLSPSPPFRQGTLGSKRSVQHIDGVIQTLLKINDSLKPQVIFPESGVSLPLDVADISAYPQQAHSFKLKHADRKASLSYSEDERRLRNELAKIQEERMANVLRVAEIEKELEAANVPLSPDGSHLAELDIPAQLTRAIKEWILERRKRKEVEWILADVKRECRYPTVVPALLKVINGIPLDGI